MPDKKDLAVMAGSLGALTVGSIAWMKEHDYLGIASVDEGDTILDLGAYDGKFFTMPVAKTAGIVYSVEPDENNVRKLKNNIEKQGIDNVVVIEKGVWSEQTVGGWTSKEGESKVTIDLENTVELTTVDDICGEYGIEHVDLLKMDIEGAEVEAVKGMSNTFDITDQIIIAAYHGAGFKKYTGRYGGSNVSSISSILEEREYKVNIYYPGLVYGVKKNAR